MEDCRRKSASARTTRCIHSKLQPRERRVQIGDVRHRTTGCAPGTGDRVCRSVPLVSRAPLPLPSPASVLKLILQISKGLIRDARARRTLMFYGVLIAIVVLFIGAVVIDGWLRERPLLFVIYWAACAWLTLLSVLLAVFDMLLVRAEARRQRKRLERRFLAEEAGDDDESAG